jgi:hypothetical protein
MKITRIGWMAVMALTACAQDEKLPQPPVVKPAAVVFAAAPSDAVVLFDGKSAEGWVTRDGKAARCEVARGEMICKTGVGDIVSKERFGSAQIHVEFALPKMLDQKSQMRANSGVYVQGRYEVQVLDNFQNPTYPTGHAGAVYGQHVPTANPSLGPEVWQAYDLLFKAPKCEGGKVTEPGRLTLLFNGVMVQNQVPIAEATGGSLDKDVCAPGPLMLQDHSGFPGAPMTALRFRNIWVRKLD